MFPTRRYLPGSKVYIPVPTWSNHHNVWADAGVKEGLYRYYKKETRGLDFEGMMEDIKVIKRKNRRRRKKVGAIKMVLSWVSIHSNQGHNGWNPARQVVQD